jgi:predicted ATPase/DNA-binding CsgD family transcriptional regulator
LLPRNNLPNQLTTFIGRERELSEVRGLLHTTRLLTLTGPGGTGKTRLALEAVTASGSGNPGGVCLVELGTLFDPQLLPQSVAAGLGLREERGQPVLQTIVESLRPQHALLVLDNCEHLASHVCGLADTLLRACPYLTILATSRQALGVEGETVWPVPPMSTPDPGMAELTPEELERYESVRLFVERARKRRPDLVMTPQNGNAIAQLCHRLDGIPLAIELAAARANVLSIEQIVERLDERFRLLVSPNQATPPRHKTLEGMMDWSYGLLTEPERALLRGLSVFAGGATLEAVVEVAGGELDEMSTIDLLSGLVDKSLLTLEDEGGDARYRMLETIRAYAAAKAEGERELTGLRDRHLRFYLILAEGTEDALLTSHQPTSLAQLDREHDNLRAALGWAIEDGRWTVDGGRWTKSGRPSTVHRPPSSSHPALRLSGALVWFWYFRGHLSEGRGWLERALALSDPSERTMPRAKALSAAGVLAFLQSDLAAARSRLEESLDIWRELRDLRGTAFALTFLGRTLSRSGDPQGRALGRESVAIFRKLGDRWGLALSLDFLGELAREEADDLRAGSLHDESLALYRELGHRWGVALELSHFAQVALQRGDFAAARARLEESLGIQREVGDKWMLAWTLRNLGDVLARLGEHPEARRLLDESLQLFNQVGDSEGKQSAHDVLSRLQALENEAQDTGKAVRPTGETSVALPDHLTQREVEVLGLIAEGLTDSQIAERLVLSSRTVQAHVRSIYSKLGIASRSAATRYAIGHNLG